MSADTNSESLPQATTERPMAELKNGMKLFQLKIKKEVFGFVAARSEKEAGQDKDAVWEDGEEGDTVTEIDPVSMNDLRDICAPGYGHEDDTCISSVVPEEMEISTITDFLRLYEAEQDAEKGGAA